MAPSYIRHANLYFVPVVRQRLTFAMLVRKALQQIESESPWDCRQDLMVVSYPNSIRATLRSAVDLLPVLSLVVASTAGGEDREREVFPITPGDGLIEAFRLATERDWPVELVDREFAPGNLVHDPCVKDPQWPDDSLVNVLGVEQYLDLVEPYFAQPPARHEPVDSWREAYIAEKLRRLQPIWRRLMVVLDASSLRPVIRRLREESPYSESLHLLASRFNLTYRIVQQLKPEVLVSYLDDYPRLVEAYEHTRMTGPFTDKTSFLMDEVHRIVDSREHDRFSAREHVIFDRYISNLLMGRRRICPSPHEFFEAVDSCFGVKTGNRVTAHFASYGSQLRVEHVTGRRANPHSYFLLRLEIDSRHDGFVSRTCNPVGPEFICERAQPRNTGTAESSQIRREWPLLRRSQRRLQERIYASASLAVPERQSEPFRGSIEAGIDVRRTMRSWYSGTKTLFVRRMERRRGHAKPIRNEPIIWVLSTDVDASVYLNTYLYDAFPVTDEDEILCIDVLLANDDGEPVYEESSASGPVSVFWSKRLAWLTFGALDLSRDGARELYAGSLDRLMPSSSRDFVTVDGARVSGNVPRDFENLANGGCSWLEMIGYIALSYADQHVLVVLPSALKMPQAVVRHAAAQGKKFVYVSNQVFTRNDLDKIQVKYRITGPWSSLPDMEARLSGIMAQIERRRIGAMAIS